MITPHEEYPKLAAALGFKTTKGGTRLFFKREDLHPYGSHKGRSIPVMIEHYYADGKRQFAISSSGNAALAAALYIKELNLNAKLKDNDDRPASLDIFVGNHIAPHKLEKLKVAVGDDPNIKITGKERPLQALTQSVQEGVTSLRQSTDDMALTGYEALAKEIAEIPDVGAVFIGTSSGTAAEALAQYFSKKKLPVQVHIVQTSACHPIVDAWNACDMNEEVSLADAIVDKIARRKDILVKLIKATGGAGWCATNTDIETARELVKVNTGLNISPNNALSIVGAMKAAYTGYEMKGSVVCVVTGD